MVVNKKVKRKAEDLYEQCTKFRGDYSDALELISRLKKFLGFDIIIPSKVSLEVRKDLKKWRESPIENET